MKSPGKCYLRRDCAWRAFLDYRVLVYIIRFIDQRLKNVPGQSTRYREALPNPKLSRLLNIRPGPVSWGRPPSMQYPWSVSPSAGFSSSQPRGWLRR